MVLDWPDTDSQVAREEKVRRPDAVAEDEAAAFRDATANSLLLDNAIKEVRKIFNFPTTC